MPDFTKEQFLPNPHVLHWRDRPVNIPRGHSSAHQRPSSNTCLEFLGAGGAGGAGGSGGSGGGGTDDSSDGSVTP
eukprot:1883330-Karenia_brevis.AAC.1